MVRPPGKAPGSESTTVVSASAPATTDSKPAVPIAPPPAEQPDDASINLVSGSANSRSFPTLREAIHASKPGDRVVVRGSLLVEAVDLSDADGIPKDVSIEGVNTRTKMIKRQMYGRGNLDLLQARVIGLG